MPPHEDQPITTRTAADEYEVGARVRQEREYLGLKQEDVASVLRIPRAAVSAIENGKRGKQVKEIPTLAIVWF